jgi:hypothetical protein
VANDSELDGLAFRVFTEPIDPKCTNGLLGACDTRPTY